MEWNEDANVLKRSVEQYGTPLDISGEHMRRLDEHPDISYPYKSNIFVIPTGVYFADDVVEKLISLLSDSSACHRFSPSLTSDPPSLVQKRHV